MDKEINVSASDGGQAAARDINENTTAGVDVESISGGTNIIGNQGEIKVQIGAPRAHRPARRKTESQLQAEFAQRTGIWCPKPAREWLEGLMEHHQFTSRELAASWSAGSIGWNARKNEERVVTPWVEAAFAYCVVAGLAAYLGSISLLYLLGAINQWGAAIVYGLATVFCAMCWVVDRHLLWPRRVALRVRATLTNK